MRNFNNTNSHKSPCPAILVKHHGNELIVKKMNINQPLFINQMYDPVLYICRRDNFRTDEKNSHSFLYKRLGVPFHLHLLWNVLFLSPLAKPAVLINAFFSFWIFTWRVLFIYSLRVLYIYRFFFYTMFCAIIYNLLFSSFKQQNKKIQTFLYPPLRKTWKFI